MTPLAHDPQQFRPSPEEPYLVDHYAVIGVESTATFDEIQARFRQLLQLYGPDKYQSLAPEFQTAAERKVQLFITARAVLSDAEKRELLDRKLANWQGPISRNGEPVIDLLNPILHPFELLTGKEARVASVSETLGRAAQLSGHNERLHNFLETQMAIPNPPDEIKQAYAESLSTLDTHLAIQESIVMQSIGMPSGELSAPPKAYLPERLMQIEAAKSNLSSATVSALLTARANEGNLLISGREANTEIVLTGVEDADLCKYQALILAEFDSAAAQLRTIVEQRQAVIDKRLELLQIRYIPVRPEYSHILVVCMRIGEKNFTQQFQAVRNSTGFDWRALGAENKFDSTTQTIEEFRRLNVASEWDLVFVEFDGVRADDLLKEILQRHQDSIVRTEGGGTAA